jgi:rubrerythrin
MDTGGEVSSIGKGLLTLTQDNRVTFRTRNLFGFYDKEVHHYYYLSDILKVKAYSDGFRTEVYYEEEDNEPAEVITYCYELEEGRDRWLRALAKPAKESPVAQQPSTKEIIREKETVREIVKIRCRNCGTRFDETIDRCPHCDAPA